MSTRLNPSQGTEICELLRKHNEGEWWFDSAGQRFNRFTSSKIVNESMIVSEALNLMLALFRRMETEQKTVLKMLPHYDPKTVIWSAFHSEVDACFAQVYPGCAEPLTDAEREAIILDYKVRVSCALEDWENLMRCAIEYIAPRIMEIESCPSTGRIQ